MKKRILDILILGLVVFFAVLYISLIFNRNLFTDEVFTFNLLKNNIAGIIQGTAADVHPPLYYLYAKIFEVFWPQNIQAQKIAAIIPMVATLAYVSYKVRRLFGEVAALFSLAFISCLPCTMEFAVQIRMYSLALLFVTIALISAYEAYCEKTTTAYVSLVIGSVGAAYTHYFAFVSICFINAILFLAILIYQRKQLKNYAISVVAMILLYLPWLPNFIRQFTAVREDYWIAPITMETIWGYFVWTFGLQLIPGFEYIYILLIAGMTAFTVVHIIKRKAELVPALMALLIPLLTAGSGIIISMSKSPIYRDQYIMPSLSALAIFVGIAWSVIADFVSRKKIRVIMSSLLMCFLLLSGAVQYKECYRQEYKSSYIDKTLDWMENEVGENDIILYNYKEIGYVYEYYFPENLYYVEDFDLGSEYERIWFMCSPMCWPITQNDLIEYNLWMEHKGLYGIDQTNFDLFLITHK